jgi:hypothetical protein
LAQSSVTASTTTSVDVPTPTTYGTTYLTVQDSSGNVIGAAEFTRTLIRAQNCSDSGRIKCPLPGPDPD